MTVSWLWWLTILKPADKRMDRYDKNTDRQTVNSHSGKIMSNKVGALQQQYHLSRAGASQCVTWCYPHCILSVQNHVTIMCDYPVTIMWILLTLGELQLSLGNTAPSSVVIDSNNLWTRSGKLGALEKEAQGRGSEVWVEVEEYNWQSSGTCSSYCQTRHHELFWQKYVHTSSSSSFFCSSSKVV